MRSPLVVVGDAMLDIDVDGRADRLAPDAPVPVVEDAVETARPGGAGLAALLAARDGHEVVLVTALGQDPAGERVIELLPGVRVVRLPCTGPTAVKKRVRAQGRPLLRLDSGSAPGLVGAPPPGVRELLDGAAAVLVADYGRATTVSAPLRDLLSRLPRRVPVTWDPHPRGSDPMPGARLVTPNEAEASVFARRHACAAPEGLAALAWLGRTAVGLVRAWRACAVAVTLGPRGALLSYGGGTPVLVPAPPVPCVDPCGAGDRFAVTAAISLAEGAVTTEAVQAAVASAAAFVAAGGASGVGRATPQAPAAQECAHSDASTGSPSALEVVARASAAGGVVVATGGCFDLLHAGHVATLRAARRLGDCLVVCLNSDASVRRLKGPSRPLVPAADRARVLGALECVDAVVLFEEDTPVQALRRIRPQVWAKGGDYAGADVPEAAVLEEWGGQAVVLPYLDGRSTTRLISTAATSGLAAAEPTRVTADKTGEGR